MPLSFMPHQPVTIVSPIARAYAEALFRTAVPDHKDHVDAWLTLVTDVAQVAALPEVDQVVARPAVPADQVVNLLLDAVASPIKTTPEAVRFVRLLVERRRLHALPGIRAHLETLSQAHSGLTIATIVSARPLHRTVLNNLVMGLERRFKRRLSPSVRLDASLIGGVRVMVGDDVLDASVRGRLDALQTALCA